MLDEILKWLPIAFNIISLIVGFFVGKTYQKKVVQKNVAKINGSHNHVKQNNNSNE